MAVYLSYFLIAMIKYSGRNNLREKERVYSGSHFKSAVCYGGETKAIRA